MLVLGNSFFAEKNLKASVSLVFDSKGFYMNINNIFKEAEQTVQHVLQDSSIWRQQRHKSGPQDESNHQKLWGMVEDLRRTTQFLATCGLRV